MSENSNSILLETSRFDSMNSRSYLFLEPERIVTASGIDDIPDVFLQIRAALSAGRYVAGYLAYEAGHHFADIKPRELRFAEPLAWFGVYSQPCIFDHISGIASGAESLPDAPNGGSRIARWENPALPDLALPEAEYVAKIGEIQALIAQGETYQVNFTDHVSFAAETPAQLYSALAEQQPVSYGAFMNMPRQQVLSFSPELFFKIRNGKITARPMKGTIRRGLDEREDDDQAKRLQQDAKNRAEHVMIVDLLRNDLGRICQAGTVKAYDLYAVERYKTLHQMTSTVSGELLAQITPYEIFRSVFPCGSITGAPKIRTMQIIRDIEANSRGVYSGAIGFMAPDGSSTFSVAIRTLVVKDGVARMGVGGGIVADSDPKEEYKECLLKASFLSRKLQSFELLETLLWHDGYRLRDYHLERLESSASYFDFRFDREMLLEELGRLSIRFLPGNSYRVRLTLDVAGRTRLRSENFSPRTTRGIVRLTADRTVSNDVLRRHKTTAREIYDRRHSQAQAEGLDDVIFANEREEVTEGAISNVFVQKDGVWCTPPLASGVLPGVYRRYLLETLPNVQEGTLRLEDLETADALYICNSLRGLRRVQLEPSK